ALRPRRAGHGAGPTTPPAPSPSPPPPLCRVGQQVLVLDDPLVSGRAHGHRADPGEELAELLLPGGLRLFGSPRLCLEQPLQRVLGIGDEPVDARRNQILSLGHRFTLARPADNLAAAPGLARPFRI